MPRAGFTAIHTGRIRFGKDGRWYCDGEPIANRAICQLYARAMTVGPDGRARYAGRLHEALKAESPDLAVGFDVADLEQVGQAMGVLRDRLLARRA